MAQVLLLVPLYFVIKWAVKNAIVEAYCAISGKETAEDIQCKKALKELESDSEDQATPVCQADKTL